MPEDSLSQDAPTNHGTAQPESGAERPDYAAALHNADVDQLLTEVAGRVHGVLDERARWELLLDAVLTMTADLSLDGLLERIVTIASRLAQARYAALGVLDAGGHGLRTFIHSGIDPELADQIGQLPSGLGLLGLIIERPEPLRLADLTQHPASHGFPEGHPPMHSFLGVPVRTRDKVFGNLYLTEKEGGGGFSAHDEQIVVALAAAAGIAIENAELYAEIRRREQWLGAAAQISTLLLSNHQPETGLQAIVEQAREVASADVVWIASASSSTDVGGITAYACSGQVDVERCHRAAAALIGEVAESATPRALENFSAQVSAEECDLGSAIVVPLGADSGLMGVLVLGWVPANSSQHQQLDPALPASFAKQAALSLQVARAQADRQRLMLYEERDRIGRDLHDLVIQRLFATGLSLQSAGRFAETPELRARLESAVDDLDGTIKEIRNTIFGLSTGRTSTNLRDEVDKVVQRAAATLKFQPKLSFEGPVSSVGNAQVEEDLLAVLTEALSNTARHAHASQVDVLVTVGDDLCLRVVDDGGGVAAGVVESGLKNMRERAERHGGRFVLESVPSAGGTSVTWRVPI